jgi:hypothetical protein
MSGSGGKGFPFAKIVAVLAIAFGVGLGLCGLSFVAASAGFKSNQEFGVDSLGIANISLVVMVVSAAALVLAAIGWAVAATLGIGVGRGEGDPRTLFGDKDDENKPQ